MPRNDNFEFKLKSGLLMLRNSKQVRIFKVDNKLENVPYDLLLQVLYKRSIIDRLTILTTGDSFGRKQLVNLLLNIIIVHGATTICIEDPEAHLHPKAQIQLIDVLEEISREERKRIVLTTHSELVALHLLNLVAEGKIKNDELAIYYFWREEGETKVRKLEIDKDGSTEMIPGFTDVIIEEHKRYIEAKFKDQK